MVDVGIVMPVYRQKPEYLKAAIESILYQTHKQYVFIIVIDGDLTMIDQVNEIVNGDTRVEMIVNEKNLGVAKALNLGFEVLFNHENIKYVTWVSSDNIYEPEFIEVLRRAFLKGNGKIGLVYSSFRSIDREGRPLLGENELALWRQTQSQPKEALLDTCFIGISFLYKTHVAKQIDGYRLEPVEDYDYWLRLTELCDIRYIPVELADYRVNSEYSISATLQSVENHRLWRHALHSTRHQARKRRGIFPAVSVLLFVKEPDSKTIECLENLYEQTFSNYEVHILDQSLDFQPSLAIGQISHPTVDFHWFPNMKDSLALSCIERYINTPYTLILGYEKFKNLVQLQTLVNVLDKAELDVASTFFTENLLVDYRKNDTAKLYNNELFRTEKLYELLGSIHFSGGV